MIEATEMLRQLVQENQVTGESLLASMQATLSRAGLPDIASPTWEAADFNLTHDPADGTRVLSGVWRRNNREKYGEISIREDGLCWAEWDVLRPHPTRHGWFIEAMTAWGTIDNLRSEPRLLPLPE